MECFLFTMLFVIIGGISYWNYKNKTIWLWIANKKWKEIQTDIKKIKEIDNKIYNPDTHVSWLDFNMTKKTKKEFDQYASMYEEYIQFCKSKKLNISKDKLEIQEYVDETRLYFKNPKKAMDIKLDKSQNEYDNMYSDFAKSGENLYELRSEKMELIDEVENFINSIAKSNKEFKKDFEEIRINKKSFKSAEDFGKENSKAIKMSTGGAGVGAVAGVAFIEAGPKAAIWVATTFGKASTGVAISTLNGAAAGNAALAWLGGGAITAGGHGIAAGNALLGLAGPVGWGIAGASLLASILMLYRKKLKIEENKKNQIKSMKLCSEQLKETILKINVMVDQTQSISECISENYKSLSYLYKQDYSSLSIEEKERLGTLVNNTRSLSVLISKAIE